MTLKAVVEALDTVPEAVRDFYEERDGKFALKVDGLEDVSGLKSALEKERAEAKAAREYKSLGLTPAEIKALKDERDKAAEDAAKASGNFESIRKKLTDQHQSQLAEMQNTIKALEQSEREARVKAGIHEALAQAGVSEEGAALLPDIFMSRVSIETVDGKRVVKIVDADGTPMLGKGGKDATFADLADLAAQKYPSLFKATTKPGSGTPPGGNGSGRAGTGRTTISAADLEKMTPMQKFDFFKANPNISVTT